MDGQDVIGHLMSVEREATSLLADAQNEADRRKAAATDESSKKYKEAWESLVGELESGLEAEKRKIDERREREMAEYQKRIEALPRDEASFGVYLDSVFSGR